MQTTIYTKDYRNETYAKLIEMGFDFEHKCGKYGKDRVYLMKDGKRIAHQDYYHNRHKSADFQRSWPFSHKDLALRALLKEVSAENEVA